MAYIEKKIYAGNTLEVEKYYDYKNNRGIGERRMPKMEISPEVKAELNERQAEKKLRRLMNTNFTNDDWYLTMDCIREDGEEYATKDEMKKMLESFQRKCRSFWKKQGAELKYVSVMAIGSRSARHFHLVLSDCNGLDYKEMRKKLQDIWDNVYLKGGKKKRSYIHLVNLYGDNYGDLAAYFIKQSKTTMATVGEKIGNRWNASKNLKKPLVIRRVISNRKAFKQEIRAPKGYYIDEKYTDRGVGRADFGGYEYCRYVLVRISKDERRHE